MRKVLLALLTIATCGCEVEAPDTGTYYQCGGYFICDGEIYSLTDGGGCAFDDVDAIEQYTDDLQKALKSVQCADHTLIINCGDTGKWCERRD
jgi:hypothetical protein